MVFDEMIVRNYGAVVMKLCCGIGGEESKAEGDRVACTQHDMRSVDWEH